MKLLLTAFDPFGGDQVNPAQEAVKLVPDALGHIQVVKLQVPTVFNTSIQVLRAALLEHQPDAVLCIGQAGGRFELSPERVAINLDDARIPDNQGQQLVDQPIEALGAPAYFSTLPIKAMVKAMREAGLPAAISNTAGTFVCNHLMYGLLHALSQGHPNTRGGFMHVPFIPEQVANRPLPAPCLSTQDIARGIEIAILAIAQHPQDLKLQGGQEH